MSDRPRSIADGRAALRMAALAKKLMPIVREHLPDDVTDFGIVMVFGDETTGRVVVPSTNRERVAIAAGRWVVDILNTVPTEDGEVDDDVE